MQELDQTSVVGWSVTSLDDGPDRDSLTFTPTLAGVTGYRKVVQLDSGLQLVKSDVAFQRDTEFPTDLDRLYKFHFRLSGAGLLHFSDHADIPLYDQGSGVILHSMGIEKVECFKRGERERAVTLLVTEEYLRTLFSELDVCFSSLLDQHDDDIFYSPITTTPGIAAAARALFDPPVSAELKNTYRRIRAQELLTSCLDILMQPPEENAFHLKAQDIEKINQARSIIVSNLENVPRVRDLAHLVGTNESKLMYGFKKLFDQTINDYVRTMRMNKACELLQTTDMSITQIAFEVGYEFSSNFTNAYKRYFGTTPSNTRRKANTQSLLKSHSSSVHS